VVVVVLVAAVLCAVVAAVLWACVLVAAVDWAVVWVSVAPGGSLEVEVLLDFLVVLPHPVSDQPAKASATTMHDTRLIRLILRLVFLILSSFP
jgi:hypothetical protein